MYNKFVRAVLAACIAPIVVLVLWQIAALAQRQSTIFVAPARGLSLFFAQFSDPDFYVVLGQTMSMLSVTFVVSALLGFAAGFFFGMNRGVERIANALIHGLYSIPKVTLYPMLLLFFGLGLVSQAVFVIIHGIFPMMVITMSAVGFAGRSYAKVAASNCLTSMQYMQKIVVPAIVPSLVSGLRICFSACFLSLILAELLGAGEGMGGEIRKAITLTNMGAIVAVVLDVTIIAVFLSGLLLWLERYAQRRWGTRTDASDVHDTETVV